MSRVLLGLISAALVFIVSGCAGLAAGAQNAGTDSPPGTYAFVGVDVLPMTGDGVLENQTVIVRGDRITAVGAAGEIDVPAGATRIDGEGRMVLSSLEPGRHKVELRRRGRVLAELRATWWVYTVNAVLAAMTVSLAFGIR